MTPFGIESKQDEEQSEQERLAVARRYRKRHGAELRELAASELPEPVTAAGEFSTVPLESLAAIPVLGAFFAVAVRARTSRKRLGANVLLALDSAQLHLLRVDQELSGARAELKESWSRGDVTVGSLTRKFMRDQVTLAIAGTEPLTLYASSLRANPWSAEVLRELGADVPEPLDLGADEGDETPAGA